MLTRRSTVAAAGVLLARPALAQSWPQPGRPILIVVPYAPGGSTDTSARMMAAAISAAVGAPVQVLNRPGAGGQVGAAEAARARPDGHTLLWAVLPTLISHYLDPARHVPYARESFQPVALHHLSPVTFAVRTDGPYRSVRDLVEAARATPDGVSISDSGQGATPHLGVLLLQLVTGARFASIHFDAGPPSATALLGGHVDAVAGGAADVVPGLRSGALRVIGTAGEAPDGLLPGVPTLRAEGYDVVMASASGLLAPAGTPPVVVRTLTDAVRRALDGAEYRERLRNFGIVPDYRNPEDYAAYWERDEARMRALMPLLAPS